MRWGAATTVGVLLAVAGAGPAVAHAPSPAPGAEVCRITDPAVTEVSGLAVTAGGYLVENDSSPDPARTRLFYLDRSCAVVRSVRYPRTARDPEDLVVDRKGTVWVADVGDNGPLSGGSGNRRSTIALWTLPPGAKVPKIHRLVYPDGVPRDAEALLVDGAGRPVIVTKDPTGEVFRLDGPLPTDNTEGARLTRIGAFEPRRTGTPNPFGFLGASLVTGAAVSADGTKAVIRTYSDAYEFDVEGGDVAKAITSGHPTVTPLPDEPQGEAIAYTADGSAFLTVSDQDGPASILRYDIQRTAPTGHPSTTSSPAPPPATANSRGTLLVAAFSVVALMLVAAVAVRARRRRGGVVSTADPPA